MGSHALRSELSDHQWGGIWFGLFIAVSDYFVWLLVLAPLKSMGYIGQTPPCNKTCKRGWREGGRHAILASLPTMDG
jgi:hypothetical protein